MFLDAKFITLLVFISINFLILFVVKTRTTIVISLIISHLIAVLFFSLAISDYDSLKEIVLGLVIYSMVTLFLISNYNTIYLADEPRKSEDFWQKLYFSLIIVVVVFVAFVAIFFVAQGIKTAREDVLDLANERADLAVKQLKQPKLTKKVPKITKKFYFDGKLQENWPKEQKKPIKLDPIKQKRLRDKLSDNFLLKRSSDVILLISALISGLLIFRSGANSKK